VLKNTICPAAIPTGDESVLAPHTARLLGDGLGAQLKWIGLQEGQPPLAKVGTIVFRLRRRYTLPARQTGGST